MKTLLSLIISGALVVSGYSQTRNVLVGTNNAVVQPTNFWSADASNARTGLGLGTAATNPASAFQSSSAVLSNLASSNGANLTNIPLSGVVGALATNGSASGLTNFPASLLTTNGSGAGLTNLTAANITGTVGLASNVTGTIAISNGGSGSTTAGGARTNFGLGWSALTNTNSATSLLGFTTNGQVVANTGTNVLTFTNQAIIQNNPEGSVKFSVLTGGFGFYSSAIDTNILYLPADDTVQLYEPVWNNPSVRASLGFSTNLSTLWTASNASNARSAVGLGATNSPIFGGIYIANPVGDSFIGRFEGTGGKVLEIYGTDEGLGVGYGSSESAIGVGAGGFAVKFGSSETSWGVPILMEEGENTVNRPTLSNTITFIQPLAWSTNTFAATTRTNLGLGWSALTNTNTAGFNTSLYGSGTNPVLYNTNGTVVSPTNFWQVAPISTIVQYQTNVTGTSTNAATNSRNLFLFSLAPSVVGVTNTVTLPTNPATTFEGDRATIIHLATNSANTVTAIRQLGAATNLITLNQVDEAILLMYRSGAWVLSDNISYIEPIFFSGTNASANAAASRTNLGLGATWLTNTNVSSFREAIGLGETNNVTFSNVTTSGTLTATSTVTAKTNLVVEGYVNFTTNHTNAIPATPNTPARWLQIRVGTNVFYLPAHQ